MFKVFLFLNSRLTLTFLFFSLFLLHRWLLQLHLHLWLWFGWGEQSASRVGVSDRWLSSWPLHHTVQTRTTFIVSLWHLETSSKVWIPRQYLLLFGGTSVHCLRPPTSPTLENLSLSYQWIRNRPSSSQSWPPTCDIWPSWSQWQLEWPWWRTLQTPHWGRGPPWPQTETLSSASSASLAATSCRPMSSMLVSPVFCLLLVFGAESCCCLCIRY